MHPRNPKLKGVLEPSIYAVDFDSLAFLAKRYVSDYNRNIKDIGRVINLTTVDEDELDIIAREPIKEEPPVWNIPKSKRYLYTEEQLAEYDERKAQQAQRLTSRRVNQRVDYLVVPEEVVSDEILRTGINRVLPPRELIYRYTEGEELAIIDNSGFVRSRQLSSDRVPQAFEIEAQRGGYKAPWHLHPHEGMVTDWMQEWC